MTETSAGPRKLGNWIGGSWKEAAVGTGQAEVRNPATGEVLAVVPMSGRAEVEDAAAAALLAFRDWRKVPVPARARLLFRYRELLHGCRMELAAILTAENGKCLEEALGEVQRGIECVEFAAGAPTLMMGSQLPDIAGGIESGMYRYPLGVVAGITPFNFPMMVPCWMFPLAVACGNAFLLKPSEKTPLLSCRLAELFAEAGFPPGVLNVVNGSKEAVDALLEHPAIAAVSFVGSQPAAAAVHARAAAAGKRIQALAGAKNHSIVLADADLKAAASQIAAAAFGSAGQRCMACSVVAVQESAAEAFMPLLQDAAEALIVGDGARPGTPIGPLIDCGSRDRALKLLELAIRDGAALLMDGRRGERNSDEAAFLGPTIAAEVTPDMAIWQEELFAPILCVLTVPDLKAGIALRTGRGTRTGLACSPTARLPYGSSARKWTPACWA